MNYHRYWGYGLNIAAEMEFPELLPHEFEGLPDLYIKLGIAPETITGEDVINKVGVSISPKEYLLKIRSIANYYVVGGNQIVVELLPGADEKSVRLFLLSNGMAAILHQRNTIPMHASAIEHGDGVILFCGSSGVGKSTTATMLQKMGYRVFSDDICVLKYPKLAGDRMEAFPSYPMMKLWHDSFEKTGIEMAAEADKIRPLLPKYARFYHSEFNILPKPVKQVFILNRDKHMDAPEITKLSPIQAFTELQRNSYRYTQMNNMKKRDIHFAMISEIAKVQVFKITRPVQGNTLEEVIGLMLNVFPKNE
ncbi:serine kinase [Mucilaginibacter sp.]|uniref:serine kinase n=1 Tax=Mucilaginibacter sp. TaxID=1882438 RepID=UPI00284963AD|nr:serine kinase [Mucilaginibacter sp.]MDR3697527.1 serine kinase [Mucilaginibacter sp.]